MLTPMTKNRLNGNGASQPIDAHDLSGDFRDNHERQMLYDTGKPKRYLAKDVIYRESDQVDRIYMIRSGLVARPCPSHNPGNPISAAACHDSAG